MLFTCCPNCSDWTAVHACLYSGWGLGPLQLALGPLQPALGPLQLALGPLQLALGTCP